MARPDIEHVVQKFLLTVKNDSEARSAIDKLVREAGAKPVPEARFAEAVSEILRLREPLTPDDVTDFKYHLNNRVQAMPPENWNLLMSMPNYHSIIDPPEPGNPGGLKDQ